MRKFLKLGATLLMATMVFMGCSKEAANEPNKETDNQKQEETETKDEVVVLQFAHDNNPGEPVQEAALHWQKLLDERSNGTMKLEVFPSGQLGNKSDLLDQMLAGDAIAVIGNGPFYADRGAPDLGIMQAPYLFSSWEDLDKLVNSDWMNEQYELLEKSNMKILSHNLRYGVRHTLTNDPVETVEDLKGMKIRTQSSTIHVKGFEAIGATPTPMGLSEVYTALQQGTVEGLENPISVLYAGKYQEVAKYLMLDAHIYDLSSIVVGTGFFNGLTEEQQTILMETCYEALEYQNELAAKAEAECLELLKSEGVTVTEVNHQEFKEAAESFYTDSQIQTYFSEGLVDKIEEIIK